MLQFLVVVSLADLTKCSLTCPRNPLHFCSREFGQAFCKPKDLDNTYGGVTPKNGAFRNVFIASIEKMLPPKLMRFALGVSVERLWDICFFIMDTADLCRRGRCPFARRIGRARPPADSRSIKACD